MKANTYTTTGSKSSTPTTLDKEVFGVMVENAVLLAQVYEINRRNSRSINALAKTRGEVRGGGKKPWKQKGTGRARAGTIRSPIWRGGGITFGPTGELALKKVSRASKNTALKQALSLAAKADSVKVIKKLPDSGKTKDFIEVLGKIDADRRVVLVALDDNEMVKRGSSNIPGVEHTTVNRLNANDVLDSNVVVVEEKALEMLKQRLEK